MVVESGEKFYRHDITGLRAIAVIFVILFHLFPGFFPHGYLGVDIFFVISGYVVTLYIRNSIINETFKLQDFYRRRILRLFPVLFLILTLTYIFCYILLTPRQLKEVGQTLISVAFFSQNVYFFRESGYFDALTQDSPFLHTWSLAVEEQFYFLIPIILILVVKKSIKFISILLSLMVLSLLLCLSVFDFSSSAIFYLLPFRFWQLSLGVLIALIPLDLLDKSKKYDVPLQLIGILILVLLLAPEISGSFKTLSLSVLASTSASCFILARRQDTYIHKILSSGIFKVIGGASYSIYLVHHSLYSLVNVYKFHEVSLFDLLSIFACSIVIGLILRKYVEETFQKILTWSNATVFKIFAVLMSLIMIVGIQTNRTNGFESHYIADRVKSNEGKQMLKLIQKHTVLDISKRMNSRDCFFNSERINGDVQVKFDECSKKHGKAIILIGDSHAVSIYNIMERDSAVDFLVGFVKGGCRPFSENLEISCFYPKIQEFVRKNSQSISVVLFHQSGSYFLKDENMRADSNLTFKMNKSFSIATNEIKITTEYLQELRSQANVVWLGPYIESRIDLKDRRNWRNDLKISEQIFQRFGVLDIYLRKNIYSYPVELFNFKYISLIQDFGITPNDIILGNCILYNDKDHFTQCGEKELFERTSNIRKNWIASN